MRRQIAVALCSAVLGFAALSSLVIARQDPAPAALVAGPGNAVGDRQVYSSIKDLMESVIDPSADVLWGAAGTIVDKDESIQELSPKTPEEWLEVRRAAVRIIEGGTLLMMPGRDAAPAGTKSETPGVELEPAEITALVNRNRKEFDAFAEALQGLGLEALRASDAKNPALLLDIGGRMQDICESCHQTFWYPNPGPFQSGGR
jgi:hypothetical protein